MKAINWRTFFQNVSDVTPGDVAIVAKVLQYYPIPKELNLNGSEITYDVLFGILLKLHTSFAKGHTCLNLLDIAGKTIFTESEQYLESEEIVNQVEYTQTEHKTKAQIEHKYLEKTAQSMVENTPQSNIKNGLRLPDFAQIESLLETWMHSQEIAPPYVLFKHNLVIKRYFDYECFIYDRVQAFTNRSEPKLEVKHKQLFNELFDKPSRKSKQAQAVACALAQQFLIVNGGPGTGKTYTVARILIMLTSLFPNLQISLAAPTGKAANRLSESLVQTLDRAGHSEQLVAICGKLPTKAHTIHSLIGTEKGSAGVRKNQTNPMSCDVLVIDEFSMVDSALFAKVLNACKPDCKLILVGDAQQLPSVEPGNVLHDLISNSKDLKSFEMSNFIADLTGTHAIVDGNAQYDHIVTLADNHRSVKTINDIALSVIQGKVDDAISLVAEKDILPDKTDLNHYLTYQNNLLHTFCDEYLKVLEQAKSVQTLFDLFATFRVLCPIRKGLHGVEAINKWFIQQVIRSKGERGSEVFFHGLPIIITENDPSTGLSNGDFGIVWQDADEGSQLIAHIERDNIDIDNLNDQKTKFRLSVNRLPKFEVAFALTIHKTQGSEFDRVLVIMPYEITQGCSRELLYTGITRAKSTFNILARDCTFRATVEFSNKRMTVLNKLITEGVRFK